MTRCKPDEECKCENLCNNCIASCEQVFVETEIIIECEDYEHE